MKKAFLILPMLAGISAAATTDVFDFGRADSNSTTTGAINITKIWNSNDAPSPLTGDLQNMDGTYTLTYVGGGKDVGNDGIVSSALETEEYKTVNQGKEVWKAPFKGDLLFGLASTFADGLLAQTNKNTPEDDPDSFYRGKHASITLSFSNLQAGTYTLSAFGGFFGKDVMNNVTAELSTTANWTTQKTSTTGDNAGAWEDPVTSTGVNSYNFNNASSAHINHGYALTAESITVGENGSLSFTIKGVDESEAFGRTPLNYVALTQVKTVPEPATATLSLLALAGLAMRRRRK